MGKVDYPGADARTVVRAKGRRTIYFVNVDRPLKRCVIHQQHCSHIYSRKNKALNEMGPDGGWFEVASYGEASKFFAERIKPYGIERIKPCDDCH